VDGVWESKWRWRRLLFQWEQKLVEQVEDISMKSTSILQKDVGKSGILEGTNVCVEGISKPYIYSLLKI